MGRRSVPRRRRQAPSRSALVEARLLKGEYRARMASPVERSARASRDDEVVSSLLRSGGARTDAEAYPGTDRGL